MFTFRTQPQKKSYLTCNIYFYNEWIIQKYGRRNVTKTVLLETLCKANYRLCIPFLVKMCMYGGLTFNYHSSNSVQNIVMHLEKQKNKNLPEQGLQRKSIMNWLQTRSKCNLQQSSLGQRLVSNTATYCMAPKSKGILLFVSKMLTHPSLPQLWRSPQKKNELTMKAKDANSRWRDCFNYLNHVYSNFFIIYLPHYLH